MKRVHHTPGPWAIRGDGPDVASVDGMSRSIRIAAPRASAFQSWADGEQEANARLIAAAPELLAALKLLLANIEDYQKINHLGGETNQDQVNARAAIAKAEGTK